MALSSRIPDPHTHFKKDMFVLNFLTPKTLLRFSFRALLHFYLIDIDQGIHKEKFKIAGNEKQKKLRGFSFSKRKPLFFEVCVVALVILPPISGNALGFNFKI